MLCIGLAVVRGGDGSCWKTGFIGGDYRWLIDDGDGGRNPRWHRRRIARHCPARFPHRLSRSLGILTLIR
jgi:hypothetical protein